MKLSSIFYSILILLLCISCKDTRSREFTFHPKENTPYQYQLTFTSEVMNMNYEVTCNFEQEKDSIRMSTTIDKIEDLDAPETDKVTNDHFQHFINTTIHLTYNNYGKSFSEEDNQKKIINPEFFVVEFPQKAIKVGDVWTGTKSAKPDFIFSSIKTKYTVKKIEDNNHIIAVEMISKMDDNTDPVFKTMIKNFVGTYIINNDGTVKSATLTLTSFDGFSYSKAEISIQTI